MVNHFTAGISSCAIFNYIPDISSKSQTRKEVLATLKALNKKHKAHHKHESL
jgi:hypothetical protein